MRDRLHALPRRATATRRRRHRGAGDPAGLGAAGHGGRHAVRAGAHLRPDRAVPAAERREAGCPGCSSPGSGTVPGVGVPMVLISRQARRRTGSRDYLPGDAMSRSDPDPPGLAAHRVVTARLAEGYRQCARLTRRTAPPTSGVRPLLPRVARATSTPSTRCAGWPTTSSTCPARDRPARAVAGPRRPPGGAFADRVPDRARGRRQRRPGAGRGRRTRCTTCDIDPECFDRFFGAMAMDLTTTVVRDLGRPLRLHGGLGRGDRRDDAAGAASRPARGPRAGPLARPGLPADQLPARRRRGPRPRPGLRARRRTCGASASTSRPAPGRRRSGGR